MIIGFWTFFITASWKRMFLTKPLLGLAQDLILNPFWVPVNTTDLTITFSTPGSWSSFPRLPILHRNAHVESIPLFSISYALCLINSLVLFNHLIPWPGPHATLSIHILLVPAPIEIQSSPVPIQELRIATLLDNCTWMPSVLGLLPEADTVTPCTFTLWQPLMTMWNIWLFSEISLLIAILFELENASDCIQNSHCHT